MMRKLAPFHFQMTQWALEQIRDHAAAEGARWSSFWFPPLFPPIVEAQAFDDIRPTVDSVGVPVIDLRDTFRYKSLRNLQVEYGVDVHPNAARPRDHLRKSLPNNPAEPEVLCESIGNLLS